MSVVGPFSLLRVTIEELPVGMIQSTARSWLRVRYVMLPSKILDNF